LIDQLDHLWDSKGYNVLWITRELGDQIIDKGSRKNMVTKPHIIIRVKKKGRGHKEGMKSDDYRSLSPILKVNERKAKDLLLGHIRPSMRISSKKVDKQ
jgi:hypothetical protein